MRADRNPLSRRNVGLGHSDLAARALQAGSPSLYNRQLGRDDGVGEMGVVEKSSFCLRVGTKRAVAKAG